MMRSRRQQQQQQHDSACPSIHSSKQLSLLLSCKRPIGNAGSFREGAASMLNYGPNEYERDESPVSVISHSATIVSQPSSACASMEHLTHLIARSGKQRTARSSTQQSPLSQSTATSGASNSEDDSMASCNTSSGFTTVPPQAAELSSQQTRLHCQEGLASRIATDKRYICDAEYSIPKQTSTAPIERISDASQLGNATDNVHTEVLDETEGDKHLFSIDLQGLKVESGSRKQNFLKKPGMRLSNGKKQNYSVEQLSAISKHHNDKTVENQLKRNMSTPTARKELSSGKPFTNWLSSKVTNPAEALANSKAAATVTMKIYETSSLKAPTKAFGFAPTVISRQRSLHCGGLAVPSKWDDAEKWLCYDNRHDLQRQNEPKSPSVSGQTSLPSSNSTPNSGERLCGGSTHLKRKEGSASPSVNGLKHDEKAFEWRTDQSSSSSRENLSVRKAHKNVDNTGTNSIFARHAFVQNVTANSSKALPSTVGTAISAAIVACSPRSSSSNEMLGNGRQMHSYLDPLKAKSKEVTPQANPFPRSVSNHTSSGEIANAQFTLECRSSALSVSDGEVSCQPSTKQHCNPPSISPSNALISDENKMKGSLHPPLRKSWIRDNADIVRTNETEAIHRPTGICASDGELYEAEALVQQLKSGAGYAQRFKQHQLLQKLRRKCSQKQGAPRASATIRKENEEAGGNVTSTNVCSQKEFMVQTPTHGRSASMKDACTEVSPSLSRRDMGTQVTPPASSPATSKSASPLQNTSPARHNTPTQTSPTTLWNGNSIGSSGDSEEETNSRFNNFSALALGSSHWAKLELRERPPGAIQISENNSDLGSVNTEWSPAYGFEEEIGSVMDDRHSSTENDLHSGGMVIKRNALDVRAAAWKDSERVKLTAKFQREEARITAWENLQKAKAEADLKKLEVKLEKLRSKATAKVMTRVASAQKRADEMRAAAEVQQAEQIRKMREKACSLRRNALFPGSFTVCFARTYMA